MNNKNENFRKLFISHSLKTCTDFYKSARFRIFTRYVNKINLENSKFTNLLKHKTMHNSNIHRKFFNSFHKSLIHKKLSFNQNYMEIENRICNTERGKNENNSIESYQNKNLKKSILRYNLEKIFLTNNENSKQRIFKNIALSTNTSYNTIIKRKINLDIQANIFFPFNTNRNDDYPNILSPKISDFVEDIKKVRTVKFINNIKIEQHKQKSALVGLETEKADLIMHSLTNSFKLLKSYNTSFTYYNKFLVNEIKQERKALNNLIINENILKEQVVFLQKKFDDLMEDLKILNNFKNLFNANKNKEIIKSSSKEKNIKDKTFADLYIEKLKSKILLKKKRILSLSKLC